MDTVYEILQALAFLAGIARALFELLDRWREHKQRRMDSGEKGKTGGHRSS